MHFVSTFSIDQKVKLKRWDEYGIYTIQSISFVIRKDQIHKEKTDIVYELREVNTDKNMIVKEAQIEAI